MDWRSYDSVAEAYEAAAVPRFDPFARDLVAAVGPRPGQKLLDLGTGTGLVARRVRELAGPGVAVIGLDLSRGMLGRARTHAPHALLVAGAAPTTPVRSSVFDLVLANLVLSHVPDPEAALVDVHRVLRPGGLFGCTAWGPDREVSDDHQVPIAYDLQDESRRACGIDVELPEHPVPSEDPLREPGALAAALERAGFADLAIDAKTYARTTTVDDFLGMQDWVPTSRYVRSVFGAARFQQARDATELRLRGRFPDGIPYVAQLRIATGRKPEVAVPSR